MGDADLSNPGSPLGVVPRAPRQQQCAALVDGEAAFRRICEAIEAAHHSVWATIAFLWADFEMPDGRGSAFDVLDRAAARGLDVRVLFWRHEPVGDELADNVFWGSPAHREWLRARGSRVAIRWDRAHPGYAQHQKSWLIDAGGESETAFVGGIDLNPRAVVRPGHGGKGETHDVYVEIAGPCAADVHHNFAQRWNEASERNSRTRALGQRPRAPRSPFPGRVPEVRGASLVQVQRTIHRSRYTDSSPAPGAAPFDIATDERSIFEQYRAAIGGARRSIYIENQYLEVPGNRREHRRRLGAGSRGRGADARTPRHRRADNPGTGRSRTLPRGPRRCSRTTTTSRWPRSPVRATTAGATSVYVHSKLMLVDDTWATIGSCNLHSRSLFGSSEMNAAIWDPAFARKLRCELLAEHLGTDTSQLDDRATLRHFAHVAHDNRLPPGSRRQRVGGPSVQSRPRDVRAMTIPAASAGRPTRPRRSPPPRPARRARRRTARTSGDRRALPTRS